MAIECFGFTGTINQEQWARLAPLLGTDYSVADSGAQLVSAIAGSRSIRVAAGDSLGHGVVARVPAGGEVIDIAAPSAGKWYLVVMRRNWSTFQSTIVLLDGAATTAAQPSDRPSSYPAPMEHNPSVLDDQPLAWVWVNNVNTSVLVWDLRKRRIDHRSLVVAFSDLEQIPATFTPSQHTLDSHSGTLGVAKGGTGATSASQARTNLGAAPTVHTHHWNQIDGFAGQTLPEWLAGNYAPKNHTHDHAQILVNGNITLAEWVEKYYAAKAHNHHFSQVVGFNEGNVADWVNTRLNTKADGGHTHDDRYHVKSAIDSALNGKSNNGHGHDISSIFQDGKPIISNYLPAVYVQKSQIQINPNQPAIVPGGLWARVI